MTAACNLEHEILATQDAGAQPSNRLELAGEYDVNVVNDNLIRLHVKAFGWEVNRNNFVFNPLAVNAEHADAFGDTQPSWKSFERQLVNLNHKLIDNGTSYVDRVIGFIEAAVMEDDGVYLDLILWKRVLTETQITQVRDKKVSVSMEVAYTDPRRLVDGKSYEVGSVPAGSANVIRTMADHSVLSFVGIAVLFDGIKPGFASAEVIVTENAALEGAFVNPDTYTKECAMTPEQLQARLTELETKNQELADANTSLSASVLDKEAKLTETYDQMSEVQAKLDSAWTELNVAKALAFDANINAVITMDTLSEDARAFAVNQFSCKCAASAPADFVEMALMFKEIGAAVIAVATNVEAAAVVAAVVPAVETPAAAAATEASTEIAALDAGVDPAAVLSLASAPTTTPTWSHRHL